MVMLKVNETFMVILMIFRTISAIGEKAKQKCEEYASYVYVEESSPLMMLWGDYEDSTDKVSKCGIVETPLIIGGESATLNEFPHMAAIGYQSKRSNEDYVWNCGGAIISETFILSAAHCSFDIVNGPPVVVKIGMTDLESVAPYIKDIGIAEIINHPEYKQSEKYNDIALYRLNNSIKFNEYSRPACISSVPVQWSKAIVIGFGKTEYDSDSGSRELMKVLISNIDRETCNRAYRNYRLLAKGIVDSQFCAGELEGKKDSCQGDSGGPLQIVLAEPYCMYQILGITSFGKFCGFANSPGVYTDVASYIGFIENIVWP